MHNLASPHVDCANILETLRSSGLVYYLNETPYSAYITVRKKYIKEYSASKGFTKSPTNDTGYTRNQINEENTKLKDALAQEVAEHSKTKLLLIAMKDELAQETDHREHSEHALRKLEFENKKQEDEIAKAVKYHADSVEETETLRNKLEDAEQASKIYTELNKKLTDKLVRLEFQMKSNMHSPHHAYFPTIQPCSSPISSPKCSSPFTQPNTSSDSDISQHNTAPSPATMKANKPKTSSILSNTLSPSSTSKRSGSPFSYSSQISHDSYSSGLELAKTASLHSSETSDLSQIRSSNPPINKAASEVIEIINTDDKLVCTNERAISARNTIAGREDLVTITHALTSSPSNPHVSFPRVKASDQQIQTSNKKLCSARCPSYQYHLKYHTKNFKV